MNVRVVGDAMRAYYDRRAAEYDDWWLGNGRFAERDRPGWHEDVNELVAAVGRLPPAQTLDVACGTGFLTRHLRGEVTAVDQSPAMVEIAGARMPDAAVVCGDAVPLPFVDGGFDILFTSHFYGHLLEEERAPFLAEARRVARRLVVVDSALRPGGEHEAWQERILNDGTRHAVYKRWFTAAGLADELGGGDVLHAGGWFVAVEVELTPQPAPLPRSRAR